MPRRMPRWVVGALRVTLVVLFLGTVLTQVLFLPLMAADVVATFPEAAPLRPPTLALAITGVGTVQVAVVCVWRLVTMAARETIFSNRAFRVVDVLIGAACLATVLALAQLVLLVTAGAQTPGAVLAVLAALVAGVGVALVVVVLRALLARAVALDAEATVLRAAPGAVT